MKSLKKKFGFAALLILIFAAIISANLGDQLHDFVGMCEKCHMTNPGKEKKNLFARNVTILCLDCHEVSTSNSHPVGISPSMKIPKFLPLDWKGRITCATCHDPHARDYEVNPALLRTGRSGKEFCTMCHKTSFPYDIKHLGAGGIAHSKRTKDLSIEGYEQMLDPVTLKCLQCHDGSVASDANNSMMGDISLTYTDSFLDHPIGMNYSRSASKNNSGLKPVEMLSEKISLYDGKVGCGSCHSVYSKERKLLTASIKGSQLCLECHDK